MIRNNPSIFSYDIKTLKQKIDTLVNIGYTYEEVIKMTITCPSFFSYNINNLDKKIEDLITIGYSHKEVLYMIRVFPALITVDIDSIKEKIENLEELGYFHDEVLQMIKNMPSIISFHIDTLKDKINFYKSIKLETRFINNTKNLIQGVELSYARYKFYESIGITIDADYNSILFMNQKNFEAKYKLNNKELIKMYNYKEKTQ